MKRLIVLFLLLTGICLGAEPKGKMAIILQSGNETNEGAARAMHALVYAEELLQGGYEVVLIFDGAGTGWAHQFSQPEHKLHKEYMTLKKKGIMEVICDGCAESMEVKDKLPDSQKRLLSGDYKGHPSIVKWIEKGYRVFCL